MGGTILAVSNLVQMYRKSRRISQRKVSFSPSSPPKNGRERRVCQ
eukprot:UN01168